MTPERIKRNVAVVAHIDAGKTTLSERFLYFSRAIPETGEVDDGMSTMDYLPEEQNRGITISAGIASYTWRNCRVTLIDTPGHVDFGMEVDIALENAENALVIVSSTRGIESQTLDVWEKIRRKKVRPMIFINKLDVPDAGHNSIMDDIRSRFEVNPFLMTLPVYRDRVLAGVADVLNETVFFRDPDDPRKVVLGCVPSEMQGEFDACRNRMIDAATLEYPELADDYLSGKNLDKGKVIEGLCRTLRRGTHVPVFLGSARTGTGVRQLLNGICFLLKEPVFKEKCFAQVVKTISEGGRRKLYVLKLHAPLRQGRPVVKQAYDIQADILEKCMDADMGSIIAAELNPLLKSVRPGDILLTDGSLDSTFRYCGHHPPLVQARIEAVHTEDYQRVREAAEDLVENDPSLKLKYEADGVSWTLFTVGEVQFDVFCERLKNRSGCEIQTGLPRVQFEERLIQPLIGLKNSAEMGGRRLEIQCNIKPFQNSRRVQLTNLTPHQGCEYQDLMESVLIRLCERGVAGFGPVVGIAAEVVKIWGEGDEIPLPLLSKCLSDCIHLGFKRECFSVFEPVMKMELIFPSEFCGSILADLQSRGGKIKKMEARGQKTLVISIIPLQRVFGYASLLRALSKGQGSYTLLYDKHDEIK